MLCVGSMVPNFSYRWWIYCVPTSPWPTSYELCPNFLHPTNKRDFSILIDCNLLKSCSRDSEHLGIKIILSNVLLKMCKMNVDRIGCYLGSQNLQTPCADYYFPLAGDSNFIQTECNPSTVGPSSKAENISRVCKAGAWVSQRLR